MTRTMSIRANGIKVTSVQDNVSVGDFSYKGAEFRFATANNEELSRLAENKSEESIDRVLKCLTIFRLENGEVMYIVCNKNLSAELALHISEEFNKLK